jgi:hypothetical protein
MLPEHDHVYVTLFIFSDLARLLICASLCLFPANALNGLNS